MARVELRLEVEWRGAATTDSGVEVCVFLCALSRMQRGSIHWDGGIAVEAMHGHGSDFW